MADFYAARRGFIPPLPWPTFSPAFSPLTMTTAEKGLGIHPATARFAVPLGATVNKAGTALYQAVATLFLALLFGVELGLAGAVLVVVMATGSAIGSPGTPGVGIVLLATILTSVGIPAGIAIILGVDRLLDMCRTAIKCVRRSRRLRGDRPSHRLRKETAAAAATKAS